MPHANVYTVHSVLCPSLLLLLYPLCQHSDQDRTPKGAVFRLHGLFLDIVTDSLNILPPLLYARVVTGHSWGMFLEIDLWGQRAYVLSRRAVPLVAIPLRRVLRDTHAT